MEFRCISCGIGNLNAVNVLGLDLGNTTGWALFHSGAIRSGVWRLSKGIKKADRPFRLNRLYHQLDKLVETIGCPAVVSYEQPAGLRGHAAKVIPAYQGIVELWMIRRGLELKTYTPSEVKRFATGKGKSNKDEMMEAAERRWGYDMVTHDEADALWIMQICLEKGVDV
jgi:Holliday junction resolvasome RuvABC endonuclease subunit